MREVYLAGHSRTWPHTRMAKVMEVASGTAQSALILRQVTPQDLAVLARLARDVAGQPWTESFVDWKYFENPAGPVHGCCAELGGRLVGLYGAAPVRIKVGHRVVIGAQSLDAMVRPEVRRQGLFGRLGAHAMEQIDRAGVELAYAMANPISRRGSVKKLAWTHAGEIPRYVKVLNAWGVADAADRGGLKGAAHRTMLEAVRWVTPQRFPGSQGMIRTREVDAFDARFDGLWAKVAQGFPMAVVRDSGYLAWRYEQNPLVGYRILVAERTDTLAGYAVLSLRYLEKDGTVALAELMVAPGDAEAGLALLAGAEAHARELGGVQLQCWMLSQHGFYRNLLVQSGFVFRQNRFLPRLVRHTTSFIVRNRPGFGLDPDPCQLGNWFLTMGDQDHF